MKEYRYGMRNRGFSPGCQPMKGFDHREDDPTGKYFDVLVYSRPLCEKEVMDYELDCLSTGEKLLKKQVISFNEEFLDLDIPTSFCAVSLEDAQEKFHNFVKGRIVRLLDVSEEEAETMMSNETDEVHYFENEIASSASIHYSGYNEYIVMRDIPDCAEQEVH